MNNPLTVEPFENVNVDVMVRPLSVKVDVDVIRPLAVDVSVGSEVMVKVGASVVKVRVFERLLVMVRV